MKPFHNRKYHARHVEIRATPLRRGPSGATFALLLPAEAGGDCLKFLNSYADYCPRIPFRTGIQLAEADAVKFIVK